LEPAVQRYLERMTAILRDTREAELRERAARQDAGDVNECFANVEAALRRIERAASRLKSEAALLRVERALNEAPLVPAAEPERRTRLPTASWPHWQPFR